MALPDCVSVVVSFAPLLLNAKRDITRITGKIFSREFVYLVEWFLLVFLWLGFGSRLILFGGSSLGVVFEKQAVRLVTVWGGSVKETWTIDSAWLCVSVVVSFAFLLVQAKRLGILLGSCLIVSWVYSMAVFPQHQMAGCCLQKAQSQVGLKT